MNRRHFISSGNRGVAERRGASRRTTASRAGRSRVVVGYQPYYTQSWSGVVMRGKKFYEKYLPKGSNVEFQIGLQGAIIVNNMLAGKQHIGYMGDMPSIVSTTKQEVADVRLVANLGLAYDQCNAFLARNDAPQFKKRPGSDQVAGRQDRGGAQGQLHRPLRAGRRSRSSNIKPEGVPEPEHRGDHLQLPRRQARRGGDVGADHLAPGAGGPRAPASPPARACRRTTAASSRCAPT